MKVPLLKMFHRKWLVTTLLVFLGTALCIRLGIWQLDRLESRRAFNVQVESMRALPPLDLNQAEVDSVAEMEWRSVRIAGEYDFENQVALRNQYYGSQYGYHLWTPLLFDGTAVLVDRGWIPADGNSAPSDWRKYDEPGMVNIAGQIRLGQTKPALGGVADAMPENGARLEIWNNGDVERILDQLPYPALPVYIQPDSDATDVKPPIPFQPEIELTEGPHFGYALQWFGFASILFIGYPFYLRKQEIRAA
jgi:surfeit locus 1 family protein